MWPLWNRCAPFALMIFRQTGIGLLLLGLCMILGCDRINFPGDTHQAVESRLSQAKRCYERRDYQGAIKTYEEILRVQPRHSEAYFQMALIYDQHLNDYLSAIYYYQRFLDSPNSETSKVELTKGFLENAKLQFAASIPNASGQNSPELAKLKTENAALHRQIEDLKREIIRGRLKLVEAPKRTEEKVPTSPIPAKAEPNLPPPPHAPRSKTYVVKKGEGIQAIAEKVYGDRGKWREIVSANPSIKDPNRLTTGQVLNLP